MSGVLAEATGIDPHSAAVQRHETVHRSATTHCLAFGTDGGGERDRTDDLRLAKPSLSQLSYAPRTGPVHCSLVGLARLELATLRLSGVRSNHLSYRPDA